MLGWLRSVRDGRVRRRLLRDEDAHEDIVDEVHHHWVVYTVPALEVAAAAGGVLPVPGLLGRRSAGCCSW